MGYSLNSASCMIKLITCTSELCSFGTIVPFLPHSLLSYTLQGFCVKLEIHSWPVVLNASYSRISAMCSASKSPVAEQDMLMLLFSLLRVSRKSMTLDTFICFAFEVWIILTVYLSHFLIHLQNDSIVGKATIYCLSSLPLRK